MTHWWHGQLHENLFMEVTTRADIGADLNAPAAARGGALTSGYSLVGELVPGDLIVHYSSTVEAIVGTSRVSGVAEPAPVFWAARGTSARRAGTRPRWLPGVRVPLDHFGYLPSSVTLADLRVREAEIMAVRAALKQAHPRAALFFPWTPYAGRSMRTFQSYLVKVPRSVADLFPPLAQALSRLDEVADTRLDVAARSVAEDAIGVAAGKSRQRSGQGFQQDQAVKAAVEAHSMDAAIEYWTTRGHLEDVHGNQSYDLVCVIAGEEVHIEVKGTTTAGEDVILTPNEVDHARTHPHVCLFVVSDIEVLRHTDGTVHASGGTLWNLDPWRIDEGKLKPLGFMYSVPRAGRTKI